MTQKSAERQKFRQITERPVALKPLGTTSGAETEFRENAIRIENNS